MHPNTEILVELIQEELTRLDSLDSGSGGFFVSAEDDLPDGWVRIGDSETVLGPAAAIFKALKETDFEPGENTLGEHLGYLAAWEAIRSGADGSVTVEVKAQIPWNDYHEFVGIDLDGGLGLLVFRTNGGLQWGFSPTGNDFSAFNSTHDFSERYPTATEAKDDAASFAFEETERSSQRV